MFRQRNESDNPTQREDELNKKAEELIEFRKAMIDTEFAGYQEIDKYIRENRLATIAAEREERKAKRKALAEQNDK